MGGVKEGEDDEKRQEEGGKWEDKVRKLRIEKMGGGGGTKTVKERHVARARCGYVTSPSAYW